MTWFKVDDGLAFHTKTLKAGNAAMGLWVRAGAACARELSDGFVPKVLARQLGTAGEARRLVEARLWIEVDGGYLFHEWEQANPSRAEVEDKRSKRAAAGRSGGVRSGQIRRSNDEANNEAKPEALASRAEASPSETQADLERGRDVIHSPDSRSVGVPSVGASGVPPAGTPIDGEANASCSLHPGANPRPGPARPVQTPLLTLVGRLAVSDARDDSQPPAEQIALWQDIAGPGVDLEDEARRYLERNLNRPADDEAAAWIGWLRAGARRRAADEPVSPRPACGDPNCVGGWLPDRDGAPNACRTCKPHLRPVRTSEAS